MNQPLKTLHIFDDAIIVNDVISLYSKIENVENTNIVLSNNPQKWLENEHIKYSLVYSQYSKKVILNEIRKHDIIIFQGLSYEKAKILLHKITFSSKFIIWALWGYEVYNIDSYFSRKKTFIFSTFDIRGLILKIKEFYTYKYVYRKAIKKIDICFFLLEFDFLLLKKNIDSKAVWHFGYYQTILNITSNNPSFKVFGTDVLVGNSSTTSNNHIALFEKIGQTGIHKTRSIICPLTYGDNCYKQIVTKEGKKVFGAAFIPLENFIALEEYMKVAQGCSHVIMGHFRQQAFGTILLMLYGGAKVFLSEKSPLLNWFRSIDIKIYSIENELENEINTYLGESEIEQNRQILKMLFSEPIILNNIQTLLFKAKNILENK